MTDSPTNSSILHSLQVAAQGHTCTSPGQCERNQKQWPGERKGDHQVESNDSEEIISLGDYQADQLTVFSVFCSRLEILKDRQWLMCK